MPLVHRKGDATSGHGCFPPTIPSGWSPDVFVNGKNVVRNGDGIVPHGCPVCPPHGGSYVGSHTVFINGKDCQVAGDPISCGDSAAAHSPDVHVDG